ncbi:ER protein Pkr1, putative [Trypanosoma equiperdum]|uniref:ER protein Pkr1 n=3 Tax=Trypanozoon TaxID=39700 RepID=C9ZIL6_TRYB9|nr:hypothetical protein, conserved [Trypanosoma brucei gambiense DAL972]RHW74355.1 ER protein Pkr1 [Trypanosoma brucei equiperdum]CBH09008.1 hypothetical protein, conserved [Trypanosoma brucei gambiense DAL972]SCU71063.1 ER protein Pkr1, putative [Trypanosoma equiperdum]|eukprot:XP_011771449.1 hypothetical protein, conserved [Trypanosoma brucei gambiense DAL972]
MAEEAGLPWVARFINHILTPGSALSPVVWCAFNVVMAALLLCWLPLLISMPSNIHLWVFGFLGAGLAFSTNWFFRELSARPPSAAEATEHEVREKRNQ